MELTREQQEALDYCLPRLQQGQDAAIVGYAGTGKSTVSTELIKYLSGYDITYVAFTNKAAQVLERMLTLKGLGFQCEARTIHSLLKLNSQEIDNKTGKRRFKKSSKQQDEQLQNYDSQLLVIDEMGCIPNNEESPLALELLQLPQRKLFMGDPCQLPPIGEDIGLLFDLLEDDTCYLSNVVRYGGAILDAATHLRNNIKNYDATSVVQNDNDGKTGIFKVPSRMLKTHLTKFVKDDRYQDKDFFRVITYTNKAMDYWNDLIRHILYPEKANKERFIVGSRIVALESCVGREPYSTPTSRGERTVKLLSASSEATINNVIEGYCDLVGWENKTLKTYYLEVTTEYGSQVVLHVIHEDAENLLSIILKDLQKSKEWKEYYRLLDYYHKVNDAYSLTIQRMQGSTCNAVLLDVDNFNSCKDIWRRNRMFYTGLTRAEQAVYI